MMSGCKVADGYGTMLVSLSLHLQNGENETYIYFPGLKPFVPCEEVQ
jgi:hypothetical protein